MLLTLLKQYWWIVLVVLALLVLQSTKGSRNKGTPSEKSEDLPYVLKRYLMSKAERSFFGVLEQVTDSSKYYIFPQVSLNNLVTVEKGTGSYQAFHNKVDRKSVDFVLFDRNAISPVLAIELDDSSHDREDRQELPGPGHYRYAVKMATGSGKTLVMAMAIVWSFFHRHFEANSSLSRATLILAPNIIVFERLRGDFEDGSIFRDWDLIPHQWDDQWQMSYIMRGDLRKTTTEGTVYLTNIDQLHDRSGSGIAQNPVQAMVGPTNVSTTGSWEESMLDRVLRHDELLLINDEAHHVHDTVLKWYQVILRFQDSLKQRCGHGLSLQLDFTATPKDQNGTFFPWIVSDYPLAQAVEDRIVKVPLIVHQTDHVDPERYSKASDAYLEWINIAVSRWREHAEAYGKIHTKPVLFVMAEDTRDANDIAEYMRTIPDFAGKDQVLLIHTDKTGEITKSELEKARVAAKAIDSPGSAVRAIVSVMMLREGWDVRNVSVILGLRPFTAKANILPEQAVGRGLRLMRDIGPDYTQIVEVVGTPHFEEFVKQLEVEGVGVGVTTGKDIPLGDWVYPVKVKAKYDLKLPILYPTYTRQYDGIDGTVLKGLLGSPRDIGLDPSAISHVALVETVTQKTVAQKQVTLQTHVPELYEILPRLCQRVCKEAHLEVHFAELYPLVQEYVRTVFFGREVDLGHVFVRRQLTDAGNSQFIVSTLAKAIGERTAAHIEPEWKCEYLSLLELEGFYWRRSFVELDHTVFNITPTYNDFEGSFAKLLDRVADVTAWAKLAETFTKFRIEYLNHKGALGFYYPDFVAAQKKPDSSMRMWLVETKGWEHEDVPLKDRRATEWCSDATALTGIEWRYIKVPYEQYRLVTRDFAHLPSTLNELVSLIDPRAGELL